jgi:ATP-binding cassette subfamily B protein
MNSQLSDVLGGIRVVKAFAKENEESVRFHKSNALAAVNNRKLALFNNYVYPYIGFILYLGNVISLGVGGYMVMKGQFTYGELITFTAYVNMIYSPMYFFADMVDWSASSTNALQRLYEISDTEPDITEKADAITPEAIEGNVEFRNVDFAYTKNRKVIDNVSFDIQAGKTADIVVFDPNAVYKIDTNTFASKGHNTPFDGYEVTGKVVCTICDGNIVFEA